jgi:hypothetical protein
VKIAFSPFFMVLMPKSHPFITWPVESNSIVCLKYATPLFPAELHVYA